MFCREYLCDEEPDCTVVLSQEDIDAERKLIQDERRNQIFSDAYLETLALYRKLALPLLDRNTIIFHGSVVVKDGWAYLFTAPSGTGKTTHTRLWLDHISDCEVLNGDKPLLRVVKDSVLACGTPWQGKENYGKNMICPLKAICLLARDEENHIESISMKEAFSTLIKQTHRPNDSQALLKIVKILDVIGSRVGLYSLGCNMDPAAATVSYEGMRP